MASKEAAPKDIYADLRGNPKFASMSDEAKSYVITKRNPNFANMSPEAQGVAIQKLTAGVQKADTTPLEGIGNLAGAVGGGLRDAVSGLLNAKTYTDIADNSVNAISQQAQSLKPDNNLGSNLQRALAVTPAGLLPGAAQGIRDLGQGILSLPSDIGNAYQGQEAYQPAVSLPELPKLFQEFNQKFPVNSFIGQQLPYAIPVTRAAQAPNLLRGVSEAAAIGGTVNPNGAGIQGRAGNAALAGTMAAGAGIAGNTMKSIPKPQQQLQSVRINQPKRIAQTLPELEPLQSGQPVTNTALPEVVTPPSGGRSTPAQGNQLRGYVQTLQDSPATAPELAAQVKGEYTPIRNKDTLAEAQSLIENDYDGAINLVHNDEAPSALTFTVGQDLMRRLQSEGRYTEAADIAEKIAAKATQTGQAIQALSMWNRLTPEGALRYAAKLAAKKKGGKLDPELAKKISNKAKELQKLPDGNEKNVETAELVKLMAQAEPVGIGQKLSTLQTLGQLLNTKTIVRNLSGNALFAASEGATGALAASLDYTIGKVTGSRTKAAPQVRAYFEGLKRGAKAGYRDAVRGIDTSGNASKFDLPKSETFKNPVLASLEKALNISLKAADRAFYTAAYRESLLNQVKASKSRKITPEMVTQAHLDGLYATFQDDTVAAQVFSGIKKQLNRIGVNGFGLGDLVLKYPKTPANLLMRASDYSPIGFVNTIYTATKPLFTGEKFNQRKFVEQLSRASGGSAGLLGFGYYAKKLGLITSEHHRDDDKDISKAYENIGVRHSQLNVTGLTRFAASGLNPKAAQPKPGDTLVSYDWLQPFAVPMSAGVNIADNEGKPGEEQALTSAGKILEGVAEGANTLADQPLLQGVQQLTGDNKGIVGGVIKSAASLPSSFVPTALSQTNQLIDNTARETYDPNPVQASFNQAKAKIPGIAQTLPERVDTTGKTKERFQDKGNNLLNVLLNPAFSSTLKNDPVNREVLRIYRHSGETKQALMSAPRTVRVRKNGQDENVKLTGEQLSLYQKQLGKQSNFLLDKAVKMPEFQSLNEEGKASVLSSVISEVNAAVKYQQLGHRPKGQPGYITQAILQRNPQMAVSVIQLKIAQQRVRTLKDAAGAQ